MDLRYGGSAPLLLRAISPEAVTASTTRVYKLSESTATAAPVGSNTLERAKLCDRGTVAEVLDSTDTTSVAAPAIKSFRKPSVRSPTPKRESKAAMYTVA